MTLWKARWWRSSRAETLKHTHTHQKTTTTPSKSIVISTDTNFEGGYGYDHCPLRVPHVLHPGPGEASPAIGSHRLGIHIPLPPRSSYPSPSPLSLFSPTHKVANLSSPVVGCCSPMEPRPGGPRCCLQQPVDLEPDLMIVAAMPLDACHIDSHVAARSRSEWFTCGVARRFCFRWAWPEKGGAREMVAASEMAPPARTAAAASGSGSGPDDLAPPHYGVMVPALANTTTNGPN